MPVVAQTCPSCGAPLTIEAGRCAFCHDPIVITAPSPGPAVAPVQVVNVDAQARFSMQVEDVFSIKGRGTIATGRIASGTIQVGDALVLEGAGGRTRTKCSGIEMFRKVMDVAVAGSNVGLLLDGLDKDHIGRGDWLRAAQ